MNKILIVAGEASGDLLGAHLCQAIRSKRSSIHFFGMGGRLMQQAGVKLLINSDQLGVVGGIEVLKQLKPIRYAYKMIKTLIKQQRPDLVILIDYPGFNLRIAKHAKKNACKVFYYVSPQIWAWRYHRIHHIKKYVDYMAVLFHFEKALYQKADIPVSFVGHPIKDRVTTTIHRIKALHTFNLKKDHPIIGLFPGSRKQEVSRMLPILVATLPIIQNTIPTAQFILPLANSLTRQEIQPWINNTPITVIEHDHNDVLSLMNAAIAVSGTVTLELALYKVPMVVIYKMSAISFKIAKRLIKVPYIALCNLVAEKLVAKELIQKNVTPQTIAQEIIQLVTNPNYRRLMIESLDIVSHNLGPPGAADHAAEAVLRVLDST